MNLNAVKPLAGSEATDPRVIKRWAAENFALSIGLLRECPYHGEPFRAPTSGLAGSKLHAANVVDPWSVQLFNGNTRELLATAQRIARSYGHRCALCETSDPVDPD